MPMLRAARAKVLRFLVRMGTIHLPMERRHAIERRLRGRDEFRKLKDADGVVVSFGKSGRTWLRVMISRFYQVRHGLPERMLMGFDNMHGRNAAIPRILFTHDNYLKDYTGHDHSKEDYAGKKVVLLARHPADVAVSQFFQWKFRMRPHKRRINAYPLDDETTLVDFVMSQDAGLPKIIAFMNLWAEEAPRLGTVLLVTYESMRQDAGRELAQIVDFLGTPGKPEEIEAAVAFASVENMRRMESERKFWLSGGRMMPGDRKNPDSFKVRKAKVGGYRDYFDDDQVRRIDEVIASTLSPWYGYRGAE